MIRKTLKEQKEQKKEDLLSSAYTCFLDKGVSKTTVDEIVNKAQVAKGTFYLYFHDKEDLLEQLVTRVSYQIVKQAYAETRTQKLDQFLPAVLYFIDTIIEYFKENQDVLKLLERNFCWPLGLKNVDEVRDEEIRAILAELLADPAMRQYPQEEAFRIIYMIVEMTGSVCYSSIIKGQPDTMEHLKPTLYRMIEKMLS